MTIDVSSGSAADLDSLEPLWLGMAEHHRSLIGDRVPFLTTEESWRRRRAKYEKWLAEPSSFLLLARLDGESEVVGYACCTIEAEGKNSTFDLGPSRGDVESLSVAPEARGRGVGTALLAEAKRRFIEHGCGVWAIGVVEGNVRASALYERVGFQPWERHLIAPLHPTDEG